MLKQTAGEGRTPQGVAVQAARRFDGWLHTQASRHWPLLLAAWPALELAFLRGYLDRVPPSAPAA